MTNEKSIIKETNLNEPNKGNTMDIKMYLETMESVMESKVVKRESKVETAILELVKELIDNNEPTTIKTICETLQKRPQHVHQIMRKTKVLKKVKLKGYTLLLPIE